MSHFDRVTDIRFDFDRLPQVVLLVPEVKIVHSNKAKVTIEADVQTRRKLSSAGVPWTFDA